MIEEGTYRAFPMWKNIWNNVLLTQKQNFGNKKMFLSIEGSVFHIIRCESYIDWTSRRYPLQPSDRFSSQIQF